MRRRECALGETHRYRRLQLGEFDHLDLAGGTRRRLPRFAGGTRSGGRGAGLRLRLLLSRGLDVFFGDPPARAGALHAAQVDTVFFGEAPGDGGDPLPLAILLFARAANDVQGSLRRRTDFGSVVRPTMRVLFPARIGRSLGGPGHGFIGLRNMCLGLGGLWLWRFRGDRLGALLGSGASASPWGAGAFSAAGAELPSPISAITAPMGALSPSATMILL